jgi:hypothetical protein
VSGLSAFLRRVAGHQLVPGLGWFLTRSRPVSPQLQPCPVNPERAPGLTDQSAGARWPLSDEAPSLAYNRRSALSFQDQHLH